MVVLAMGRRWGKTTMAGALACATASNGANVGWVAPTYANSRPLWRFLEHAVSTERRAILRRNDRSVEFKRSGRVSIYTADNDIALRGESFDLVIVDEAARVKEETYTDVLLPTLADRDGRVFLMSTPRGRNWFWKEWVRGQTGGGRCRSFTAPSRDNPLESIRRASELARGMVSERTYRQEWLAEFVSDGGGVFRGVEDCVSFAETEPQAGEAYICGVDWGRTHDATVFVVMNAVSGKMVAMERWVETEYARQMERFERLYEYWRPYVIIAEQNAMGGPLVELLQGKNFPVESFAMTAASKPVLIDALALAIERREIGLLDDAVLLGELVSYESERTATGALKFSAPGGMFDDCVIATALAWRACRRSGGGVLFEV